jgi:hypothetical protein
LALDYVLNELSIATPFTDRAQAHIAMDQFADVLRGSRQIGIRPGVRTQIALGAIEIAPDYYISNWCADQAVSKEKRLYVLSIATKSPLLVGLPDAISADVKEVAVSKDGEIGDGLTVAYLTNSPLISMDSHHKWRPSELAVTVETLVANAESGEVNIEVSDALLLNFCTLGSLAEMQNRVQEISQTRFESIEEFWALRVEVFPKLEFSLDVKKTLIGLGLNNPLFMQAIEKFRQMNAYCESWVDGPCEIVDTIPNISDESVSTMQQFGEARLFRHESGGYLECRLHARLTPGAWRIHFAPNVAKKTIFVGYVGQKLPSSEYRT